MAAEEYLDVFPGAKRSGNTHAVLSQRATPENFQILTAPCGCGDNGTGGCVGFALTARMGMRARSRLACGPLLARSLLRIRYGFPQRPQCDLISGSLMLVRLCRSLLNHTLLEVNSQPTGIL